MKAQPSVGPVVPLPGEVNRGRAVRLMFDRIAPSYDLLNRLMTLRIDQLWRRRLVRELALAPGERLIDLCAGTMDVAGEARRRVPGARVVCADFSLPMLTRGARKTGLPATQADALALPFRDEVFDAAAVAFGMRNLEALAAGLREIARVLKPGGRLGVLEFFRPQSPASRALHRAHRLTLPLFGRLISPDPAAYRYLPASIERFASRSEFEDSCRSAGFAAVKGHSLVPGACGLVLAVRGASPRGRGGEPPP
ncbi:MAG TPA: ubiquinone/menaquinone biosynthesis methyltransferase [Anaeromyxobacteraceae bacterium]|nr:ubiquinone/menaquinone biosynthesis methyltransferase [Anaeromyxobacteraceae bacterium]